VKQEEQRRIVVVKQPSLAHICKGAPMLKEMQAQLSYHTKLTIASVMCRRGPLTETCTHHSVFQYGGSQIANI
jgi:hypothetical protein